MKVLYICIMTKINRNSSKAPVLRPSAVLSTLKSGSKGGRRPQVFNRAANISNISRMDFDLSEQRPLHVLLNSHPQKQDFMADMHYGLELGIVRSGRMERQYEHFGMNVGPGQVWMCGMWEPHSYRIVKAPCEVLVLVILPQMLVNLQFSEAPNFKWLAPFAAPAHQRPQAAKSQQERMHELAEQFKRTLSFTRPQRELWQRVLLMETLLFLQKDWSAPAMDVLPSSFYGRINKAVQMVFSGKTGLTSQAAAKASGLSRNYFNKMFQELMGISFAKFELRYRLSCAASQLLLSGSPAKTVAPDWGFTDACHLHRCFMKFYGCSPGTYRKRHAAADGALTRIMH